MRFLFLCCLIAANFSARADATLKVAVASNFKSTLEAIRPLWQKHSTVQLLISSGPSGVLTQQILSGAPFDLFLSADTELPLHLYRQQHSERPFVYAQGRLRLGCHKPFNSTLAALHSSKRLVLANIKTAPYGRAAWRWLQQQESPLSAQIVQSGSVANALQTVVSGNATCGLMPASFQHLAPNLHWYQLESAPLLQQAGVLLNATETNRQFIEFLLSDQVQSMILSFGYTAPSPQPSVWP